ncbi:MAG: S-layer homology domain-containing protein [Dethiobacter sp.]|jgi:hypothetical protein|nr:MAG: S-layer homology domain-containing protein [Dethiobacter sp.]
MRKHGKIKFMAILMIIAMVSGLLPISAFAAKSSDIKGHWAEHHIKSWLEKGLAVGYPDGTFRPGNTVSRAEFAVFVNRSFPATNATGGAEFSDLSTGAWYYAAVSSAVNTKIMSGYPDGTFRPQNPITRQEAASVITRLLGLTAGDKGTTFADEEEIGAWAQKAVKAVSVAGIMRGYPDGTFGPGKLITRAETVVILDRSLAYEDLKVPKVVETVFDQPGTYGPETGRQTIEGNVIINAPDITLRNTLITGDLLLGEGIGDGDVTLKNVRVIGKTTIKGGGAESITFEDCTLPSLTVARDGVRVVAAGNTSITVTILESGATLVSVTTPGAGFQSVTVSQVVPAGTAIFLSGNFTEVTVAAANVEVALTAGSVNTLTVTAAAKITGQASITTANIKAAGVVIAQTPATINVDQGITATVGGRTVTAAPAPAPAPIPSLTVSNINMIAGGSPQGTDLSALAGTVRVSGITFTTNAANSTLQITGISSPKTGPVSATRTVSFYSASATVAIADLLGFDQADIRLDTLRSVFGTTVTINGTLSATGYTSYTTPITIILGADPSAAPPVNDWVTLTQPSTTELRATIKSGMGGTTLSSIGIATFLDATFNELPSEVKIAGNSWIAVTVGNYDAIRTQLGALGTNWSNVTISDLVGKTILFKRPGAPTTVYTLVVAN